MTEKCLYCNGTGKCFSCKGGGECSACRGKKIPDFTCPACGDKNKCPYCGILGIKPGICPNCSGTGDNKSTPEKRKHSEKVNDIINERILVN